MTYHTTIYLSDEHKKWIHEKSLNFSKYVRTLIDKDIEKWKQITDVVIPIVKTEKELEEIMVQAEEEKLKALGQNN